MLRNKVQELGIGLFQQSLEPYRRKPRSKVVIFGLDTEYRYVSKETATGNQTAGSKELVCWQLSLNAEHISVYPGELSWETLYDRARELLKAAGHKLTEVNSIYFAVFFAQAECQWLDWLAGNIELYGSGRMNLRYAMPNKRHTLYIYDVSNFFVGQSLKMAAPAFGLSKLDYDVSDLQPDSLNDAAFVEYARNDAYIVGEILRQLRQRELDNTGIDILNTRTPAGTAAADFRHRFIDAKYGQRNCHLRRRNLWASWGGRKECFFRGTKPTVYEYDAAGCYPSAAFNLHILPLEDDWQYTVNLKRWLSAKGGFGSVRFQFPADCQYPCLPVAVKHESSYRVYFPSDGVSDCTTWEAEAAIEMGAKVWLRQGYYYNSGQSWLSEYLKLLIDERKETGDSVLKTLLKLKSNSIIGKLTQKRLNYDVNELVKYAKDNDLPLEWVANMRGLETDGGLPIKKKLSVGNLFYPEWNTLILGKARAIMAKAIHKTEALQVMTDAVVTEKDLGECFEIEGMRFERKYSGDYLAYRAGLYRIAGEYRYSGADRGTSVVKHALDKFMDVPEWTYTTKRFVTARQAIHGDELGREYEQERTVSLAYDDKRFLLPDGSTRPFPFNCLESEDEGLQLVLRA